MEDETVKTFNSEQAVLSTLRRYERLGDYQQAAALGDALPHSLRILPAVALTRMRMRLWQGRLKEARAALLEADLAAGTAGQRLALVLEEASLRMYESLAIGDALEAARLAMHHAGQDAMAAEDWAEAQRVYARIVLSAVTYREIDPQVAAQTHCQLPAIAGVLAEAGRWDESLAARITYARYLQNPEERLRALADVVVRGEQAGSWGLCGEASLNRARTLLSVGAPSDQVRQELAEAARAFAQVGHVHGPVDVRRTETQLAIEREFAPAESLEACLEAYLHLNYPREALTVLVDMAQLATEQGKITKAGVYRQQGLALATEAGMGMAGDAFLLSQVDLLMRLNDYSSAIELCESALSHSLPAFRAASYKQMMGTAYSFTNNLPAAEQYTREAIADYEQAGAAEAASNAVTQLAGYLTSTRWAEAEALLKEWIAKDERRGDFGTAITKREQLAQLYIHRILYAPQPQNNQDLRAAASQAVDEAFELTTRIGDREGAKRRGGLYQMRSQLFTLVNDTDSAEQCLRMALEIYERIGLGMEAANCKYIIGTYRLNLANRELIPHFGEAENLFAAALHFYEEAGMRERAGDVRFMLARLYTNAWGRVNPGLKQELLDAALGHLTLAEEDYDAVRRAYAARSVLEQFRAKRNFIKSSQRIYSLALELVIYYYKDATQAWQWCQRAKARALCDTLGSGAIAPSHLLSELESHPDSYALVLRERELTTQLEYVSPAERPGMRAALTLLREQMGQDPHLADYLELRSGVALQLEDVEALLRPETDTGRRCVCVDWVITGDRIWMLLLRPGELPHLVPLDITLSAVTQFVRQHLNARYFRHTLRDNPELLDELTPLIAPLASHCAPEELLILIPTGPLYAVPLHALSLAGQPLLARHPVVYGPSLGVIRQCLARRRSADHTALRAALFGDPAGDRAEAGELVNYLARQLDATLLTGAAATKAAFSQLAGQLGLIHFQGHARHDAGEPLDSCLQLADGDLRALDVFTSGNLRADLVTLAACESAANVVEAGDEPLGLIPAFLYAGANAVLAALWPVQSASAAQTMRHFYDAYTGEPAGKVSAAEALRRAALAVAATPRFQAPYHWAPYVLYGDWH